MKKILYLMHIDWDWIKQRPHFLAEELTKHFDVNVLYPSSRRRTQLTTNPPGRLAVSGLPNIPMQRFKCINNFNEFLCDTVVKSTISRYKPDYIWITHPDMYRFIHEPSRSKIIYDCMDDALGFVEEDKTEQKRLLELERRLIRDAYHIFVSSSHLSSVINEREECSNKVTLIRNAFSGQPHDPKSVSDNGSSQQCGFKVCYFGTVSEWFDFDALRYCIDSIPDVAFKIIGPLNNATPFEHDRLTLVGPVEHSRLADSIQDCNCFIMPFILNELIQSVDPVKLYEYISFGKPVISIYYDEIRRFEPFVHFYTNKEELASTITELMSSSELKYSQQQRIQFLSDNSWQNRVQSIMAVLER